ncbi:hypothetical protein [Paenibacillus harenae]|uniref:Uncharacterized protein n=1 Tax=Paenibacillus harenae TaxID=306543 RepID=A0ABT9U6V5_PAEHA|nr:hypothetical protein [Paenibacillus harenae]MDQ0115363.1 hypothetical protein [Paenibacillus harenae]
MFCPVCNGLTSIQEHCSSCTGSLIDGGRVNDWVGPYAPYEPINEPFANESLDPLEPSLAHCNHIIYCPTCHLTAEISVNEWI